MMEPPKGLLTISEACLNVVVQEPETGLWHYWDETYELSESYPDQMTAMLAAIGYCVVILGGWIL